MQNVKQDLWSQWLLQGRFSTYSQEQQENKMKQFLFPVRDTLLSLAAIKDGDTVLDIGCGDGLIAFAALEKIGQRGKVIFNDISSPLLEHCQTLARSKQVLERCEFLNASAEDLSALADNAVTVVTLRSVLLYIQDKQRVFSEIYRVLQPEGRFVMFEPITDLEILNNPEFPDHFAGYNITPVKHLVQKVQSVFQAIDIWDSSISHSIVERDMFNFAKKAGFTSIRANCFMNFQSPVAKVSWDSFLHTQIEPRVPTIQEAMQQTLTPSEYEQFSAHLRPLVESGQGIHQIGLLYLQAKKGA